jgi:hypothetical protein
MKLPKPGSGGVGWERRMDSESSRFRPPTQPVFRELYRGRGMKPRRRGGATARGGKFGPVGVDPRTNVATAGSRGLARFVAWRDRPCSLVRSLSRAPGFAIAAIVTPCARHWRELGQSLSVSSMR